jgi:hypothetical protein
MTNKYLYSTVFHLLSMLTYVILNQNKFPPIRIDHTFWVTPVNEKTVLY